MCFTDLPIIPPFPQMHAKQWQQIISSTFSEEREFLSNTLEKEDMSNQLNDKIFKNLSIRERL